MRYPVLLFDLFRTLILFNDKAPTGQVKEPHWRSAMEGALRVPARRLLPGVDFDALLNALVATSEEISRHRAPEHFEVPAGERYRRALVRLGRDGPGAMRIAEQLVEHQMGTLAANASLPPSHAQLLRVLSQSHRLGLVSNFDHAPTVRGLLAREGLDRLFASTMISIEFGRRKPHPAIFQEALHQLAATPAEGLFIGDSSADDVAGALAAGIDVAWLNVTGAEPPADTPQPTYVLSKLSDLHQVLG